VGELVVQADRTSLPGHDEIGWVTRSIEVSCLVAASGLLVAHLIRFAREAGLFSWWLPFVVLAAMGLADFVSGVVHWVADTWWSETMPILGRRFLRPFRVHHVNPDDFLRRDFIDCNGDVAMLTLPLLLSAFFIPLSGELSRLAAVAVVAFSAAALPTNQVHQWAHMRPPPRLICGLQRCGLLLSVRQHQRHHTTPYVMNYCIATGWCNRPLTAINFFSALEWAVSRCTGLQPRQDDRTFAAQLGGPTREQP
jgi:plasmanylethanolamine desaturase